MRTDERDGLREFQFHLGFPDEKNGLKSRYAASTKGEVQLTEKRRPVVIRERWARVDPANSVVEATIYKYTPHAGVRITISPA